MRPKRDRTPLAPDARKRFESIVGDGREAQAAVERANAAGADVDAVCSILFAAMRGAYLQAAEDGTRQLRRRVLADLERWTPAARAWMHVDDKDVKKHEAMVKGLRSMAQRGRPERVVGASEFLAALRGLGISRADALSLIKAVRDVVDARHPNPE